MILWSLLAIIGRGQHHFQLNSSVDDSLIVQINSQQFVLDSNFTSIPTHYPGFDTLVFLNTSASGTNPIICNFKPDTSYSVNIACCASLDIIPSSKLDHDSLRFWDYEKDHGKIKKQLMDRPSISMQVVNAQNDTIYGWYADYACMPTFKRLSNQEWRYGTPEKCYYWNNISTFIFFSSEENYLKSADKNGVIADIYPEPEEIEVLGRITLRLFDDQSFVLTYDTESKQVSVKYE